LYFVRSPEWEGKLIVKVFDPEYISEALVDSQYNSLKNAGGGSSLFRVPLVYFEKQSGMFAQQAVDGRTLSQHMYANFFSASRRRGLAFRAGQWLSEFHKSGEIRCSPASARPYIEKIVNAWIQLEELNRLPVIAGFEGQVDCVIQLLKNIEGKLVPNSTCHGDFYPSNILVTMPVYTGIDMRGGRHPVYIDLVRMHLHLLIIFSRSKKEVDLEWIMNSDLVESFLSGYGLNLRGEQQRFYLEFLAFEIVWRILRLSSSSGKRSGESKRSPFRKKIQTLKACLDLLLCEEPFGEFSRFWKHKKDSIKFIGHIDRRQPTSVTGWIKEISSEASLHLVARLDGREVSSCVANIPRQDVRSSLGAESDQFGFHFRFDHVLAGEDLDRLEVCVDSGGREISVLL